MLGGISSEDENLQNTLASIVASVSGARLDYSIANGLFHDFHFSLVAPNLKIAKVVLETSGGAVVERSSPHLALVDAIY